MGIILNGIQYWHEAEDNPIDDIVDEIYDDSIPVFDRGRERIWSFSVTGELDFNE